MLYSMCNWGVDGPWNFASTIANSWRTTGDLGDVFDRDDVDCPCSEKDALDCKLPGYHCSVTNIVNMSPYHTQKARKGGWNDLGILQVGNGGMSDEEYKAHFSLWAAFKSPLIMTKNFEKMDPKALSILQNTAVLAVSQDSAGTPVSRRWRYFVEDTDMWGKGEIQFYSGPLSGGDYLALFFNAGSRDRTMNATLTDVFWPSGASGKAKQISMAWDIYDLWLGRLSDESASSIIDGSSRPLNLTKQYQTPQEAYEQGPAGNSTAFSGTKVGCVQPNGTIEAKVKAHGVAMFRLRRR